MKHLGPTLDIHCGGTDHVRIHHTNEIAQSECATGQKFARFWMHGEFLRMGNSGGKMSKSSGEFLTVDVLIKEGFNPLDYRLLALTSHYRNYLNFSWEAMESARESLKSLHKKTDPLIGKASELTSPAALKWQSDFKEAIGDDLNMPKALGILNSMLKDATLPEGEKAALVLNFDTVLGLELYKPREDFAKPIDIDSAKVEALLSARAEARKAKNFTESDRIRDELAAMNVVIKDGPQGTTWEVKE